MYGEVRQINGRRVATPEYRSWQMMKNRVLNPKACDYNYYGGRGIVICSDWLTYDNFFADMGRKPSLDYTLDRIDVDGNYEKSNCCWVTRQQQARNHRASFHVMDMERAELIRSLYATGNYRQIDLARMFDTGQVNISQITRNAAWAKEKEVQR